MKPEQLKTTSYTLVAEKIPGNSLHNYEMLWAVTRNVYSGQSTTYGLRTACTSSHSTQSSAMTLALVQCTCRQFLQRTGLFKLGECDCMQAATKCGNSTQRIYILEARDMQDWRHKCGCFCILYRNDRDRSRMSNCNKNIESAVYRTGSINGELMLTVLSSCSTLISHKCEIL